jgi:Fe-S-cluster-containing hydrogenase component 2
VLLPSFLSLLLPSIGKAMPSSFAPPVPPAARDTDVRLTDEILAELSLLAPLQRRPALYRFRNSVALRRFHAGECVVRQGERGRLAYYVLTRADTLALLNALCRSAKPRRPDPDLLLEREAIRSRLENSPSPEAVLRLGSAPGPRLAHSGQAYSIGLDERYASVQEGELVGEAACLEGTPYPFAVFAVRDCYLLEMKADFLAAVQDDPVQRARAESTYRNHILKMQLSRLPLFRDLNDEEFSYIRDEVELVNVSPGTVICDEHERCGGLYIVRSGVVKLAKNSSFLLGLDDVSDWPALVKLMHDGASSRSTAAALWRRLDPSSRVLFARLPPDNVPDPGAKAEILVCLNDLLCDSELLKQPDLRHLADDILPLGEGETTRRANRRALDTVFGTALLLTEGRGPECVVTYCTRGDSFGLPDLLLNRPRSATAVALGHPNALGRVELAWLPAEAFWRLLRKVPRLREPLKQETARQHREMDRRLATPPWDDRDKQFSREAVELGLIQAQQLMLIDLERCTRCDDCVHACASSRSDGQSRLFIDGPRIGRHLLPTTCRACLDPVCLIGCPVGSIHRGSKQEIVIEDWCIGCGLCSESCPYGAIQMHDVGIITEASSGWRFIPLEKVKNDGWQRSGYRSKSWLAVSAPILLDRTMREQLAESGFDPEPFGFAFRHEFQAGADVFEGNGACRLEVQTAAHPRVWVNGRECLPVDKPRGGRNTYTIHTANGALHKGTNLLAIEVVHTDESRASSEPLLQARLDAVGPAVPDEMHMVAAHRPATRRAAVCDLCAEQPGGPACIRACPHDAARRIDFRAGFPG